MAGDAGPGPARAALLHRAAVLLLLTTGFAAGAGDAVSLGPCGPVGRLYSSVEVPAGRLRRLGGTPLVRVGLVVFDAGPAARPIPFQIDERRGRKLALPDGPEPTADDQPGMLDADDLIVFMACDAGRQRSPAEVDRAVAAFGPVTAWREIRIDDPVGRATAFAYLVVAADPPRTERRYVTYDADVDLVRTAAYRVGLIDALPVYLALSLGRPPGANLIDGLRLRAEATLRGNLARWTFDERQGRHQLVAWKAGPVRVIRRSRHRVAIGLGIHLTAGTAHTFFYPRHVFTPGSLRLPFSPSVFFRDISAFAGADGRELEGWRYLAPGVQPPGFLVDGHMDDAERGFAGRGDWFVLTHGDEALLFVTRMGPNLRDALRLRLVYRDDADTPAPPEASPGTVPLVGYEGRGVERLPGGKYEFDLSIFGLAGYHPGDPKRVRTELLTSLTADLTAEGPEAARRPTRDSVSGRNRTRGCGVRWKKPTACRGRQSRRGKL